MISPSRNEHLMQIWIVPTGNHASRRAFVFLTIVATSVSTLFTAFAPTPAWSQVSRTHEPVTIAPESMPASALESVLDKGRRLESQQRWGEALTHYEESLREHPGDKSLLQHHDLAKLHYSLDRRYNDHSFRQSIASLNSRQALSLYSELLRKISTHYVAAPPWQRIGVRGTTSLDMALADSDFRTINSLQVSPEQLSALRRELYQTLGRRTIRGPNDLVALAGDMARLAELRIGLRQSAVVLEFATAAAGGLDDYSAYLTSDQLRDVYSQIEGNFVGLGVELKADNGALLIVHVIAGSPAERAGILEGDRIVAVDGKTTAELSTDEAASMLTGQEGTWVQITARSPGQEPRGLSVRREHVSVPSLEDVKIVDADFGVAYVRVPAFQKTTSRDLESALWTLHRKGMRSLILDLRGNPGGLLTASVEAADKFLTQGGIVSTRGRSPQEDFDYQAHYGGTWRVPLVVLIDGDSASASEIFAGAIKDNNRGILVGDQSYGKGSVQGIFPLGYAGAGIRLTTAKFYSPSGQAISKHGVVPNQTVHRTARPAGTGLMIDTSDHDRALQAAIEAARQRVAAR